MQIKEILNKRYSFKSGNPLPLLDIQVILADAISKDRAFIIAHEEYELTRSELGLFNVNIKRRLKHEPIAYILGKKEFYGYEFKVNENVLIPRPETEELVEIALEVIRNSADQELNGNVLRILDIGTGSGCIPITILLELANTKPSIKVEFTAIDISDKALRVAMENYKTYQDHIKNGSIDFIICDILSPVSIIEALNIKAFDLILSNPPYIPTNEVAELMADVKDFEPHLALDGGFDGNDFYTAIRNNLKNNTSYNTVFIFEKYNGVIEKFSN